MDLLIPSGLPPGVRALSTTRSGGVSLPPYGSLNLGDHVGDASDHVAENRRILTRKAGLPGPVFWLAQCHGTRVLKAPPSPTESLALPPSADGSWTDQRGVVLGILTADCLPVLLWTQDGSRIAALHGGWKGVVGGILEEGLKKISGTRPQPVRAWIGPAISQTAYEVGPEVRSQFLSVYPSTSGSFSPGKGDRWHFDLPGAARTILLNSGVTSVDLSGACTWSAPEKFFSYRRENPTGRIATLIWKVGEA